MGNIYESEDNVISSSAFVHPNAIIGKGNVIMEGAVIRQGVQLGDNNFVGPYCVIGDPPEKHGYFDTYGRVIIGSGNKFTKQVTIDSGCDGDPTIIKSNVIILKSGHVGHNAYIDEGTIISCNAMIGGYTKVGKHCNFGLGSAVHQRLEIPEGIILGMNSTITKRTLLEPNRKYIGSPARDAGPNERDNKNKWPHIPVNWVNPKK
jgi:UDP-N-acetylglucosamine acyltransferase